MHNRIIFLLAVTVVSFVSSAQKRSVEYPKADIMVRYKYHEKFLRGNVQFTERDIPMLLLANTDRSKFFCPETKYKDSLKSTPSGRAIAKQMFDTAVRKYAESKDESALNSIDRKSVV